MYLIPKNCKSYPLCIWFSFCKRLCHLAYQFNIYFGWHWWLKRINICLYDSRHSLRHCFMHNLSNILRFFNRISFSTTCFCKLDKIYWRKFYTILRIPKKCKLFPSNHSKNVIFYYDNFYREIVFYSRSKFSHQHCKSTISYESYGLPIWKCNLSCYCIWQATCHCSKGSREGELHAFSDINMTRRPDSVSSTIY